MAGVYALLNPPGANNTLNPLNASFELGDPIVVTGPVRHPSEFTGLSDQSPPGDNYSVSELVPANYVNTIPFGDYYAVGITAGPPVTFTTNSVVDDSPATAEQLRVLPERAGRSG